MPLALKIKKKWLKRMVGDDNGKKKSIEVRSFPPTKHLPRGAAPPAPGDSVYFLCDGEVWAAAVFREVKTYSTKEAFDLDADAHQVGLDAVRAQTACCAQTTFARIQYRLANIHEYIACSVIPWLWAG